MSGRLCRKNIFQVNEMGKKQTKKIAKRKKQIVNSPVEDEISIARLALHDAAKALAILTREEPKAMKATGKLPKTIHVYPTGNNDKDIANLEGAITDAGAGGVVVLKAMNKDGMMMHFNLTKVDELCMVHEVTLRSEKNAVMRFSE